MRKSPETEVCAGPGVQRQGGDTVQMGLCTSIQPGRGEEELLGPASGCLTPKFSSLNSDEVVVLTEYVG